MRDLRMVDESVELMVDYLADELVALKVDLKVVLMAGHLVDM